jgi:pSer/pThr/pTyr-binding forkhead associated (FHA) protein
MARLIINDGTSKREVELVDAITVAGRSSDNKIHIDDKQSSRRHFQIEKTEFGFKLVDLESRNGSRVNDRVVNQALLRPGDRIQIGKHTLTFEDSHFKEPSADVAARFAPPPADAVKPVPPPPPSATPSASTPEPEPRTRRRTTSGHTTAILVQRTARMEQVKEQQMIRWVGVGAGLFIAVLVLLIFLPGTPAGPGGGTGKSPIPGKPSELDLKKAAALAEAEQRDFDALFEFCDKNRTNATAFDRILELCTKFREKYPGSISLPKVEDFVKTVTASRQGVRGKEVDEGTTTAQEQAKKNDFAGAIKSVNALIAKHKDVEINAKLVKLHDDIVDQAKEHFKGRHAEAKDLVAAGNKDQAARIYESLVSSLGDSSVPELDVWCQISKTALSGLK